MLSIYVATYNHEKYITQALDSILMQETQYTYEVLVGEDCSKDCTREVLKEYEKLHPGVFTIFYREHNMYREEVNNGEDLKRRCKGKYIIALEGDDYWTDPHKIEKQINFLETHPDYLAIAHQCQIVDENSQPVEEEYPCCREDEYTLRHFASEVMPGQLTTVMYRNFYAHDILDASLCKMKLSPGDQCIYYTLASNGKVYCMPETMSAYRHVTNNGTSFSATHVYKYEAIEKMSIAFMDYARNNKKDEALKYAEFIFMRNIYSGLKANQISKKEAFKKIQIVKHRLRAICLCGVFIFNKKVLKREVKV